MIFNLVFKDCYNPVYIRYRTSGKLLNIRHLSANSKFSININCDNNDFDLVAHTEVNKQ